MQPDRLSDEQLDELAAELAPRLPTGTHGDRVILPRRQFVAALGGTLGAGALMALGVDEATAQAAGQQGTAEEPNDMFAWDLDVQNGATFNGTDIEGVGTLSAEDLVSDYLYAGAYDASDADARLDNALTAASDGDVIKLEAATYDADRTGTDSIDKSVSFEGTTFASTSGSVLDADWTIENADMLSKMRFSSGNTLTIGGDQAVTDVWVNGDIVVTGNRSVLGNLGGLGSVTFESDTSNGSIGVIAQSIDVTDNGSNRVL